MTPNQASTAIRGNANIAVSNPQAVAQDTTTPYNYAAQCVTSGSCNTGGTWADGGTAMPPAITVTADSSNNAINDGLIYTYVPPPQASAKLSPL